MENNYIPCEKCPMRRKYETNPKSFLGRLWHWHIGFCPGWKQYFSSLPEKEKKALRIRYDFHKY